jgi:hypothetical protein
MGTVLEKCITEEQSSVVRSLWAKRLNAKDIHKEIFPVYAGKCLSRKAVDNCVEKFSQRRSNVADDARSGEEVAETTAKRLLGCGFRRTGTGVSVLVEDMSRNKCFLFQVRISHDLRFISICDVFTDSPLYISPIPCNSIVLLKKRYTRTDGSHLPIKHFYALYADVA